MKKFLLVALLVLALALVTSGVALADAGPHGGYTAPTTDACAGCHLSNAENELLRLGCSLQASGYDECMVVSRVRRDRAPTPTWKMVFTLSTRDDAPRGEPTATRERPTLLIWRRC